MNPTTGMEIILLVVVIISHNLLKQTHALSICMWSDCQTSFYAKIGNIIPVHIARALLGEHGITKLCPESLPTATGPARCEPC